VLSQSGVEQLARQEFEWNPAWEQLTLHGVWIWRDGARRVAWHPEDARVIQRESDLTEGLYDGRLTLLLELRDLREGDVVELATTTRGENPVFKGRFAIRQYQVWADDVLRSRFSLRWERTRPLHVRSHGGATEPTTSTEKNVPTWRWDLADLKAPHFEASMPSDVEPVPWVEFTDWLDWAEVSRWALELFAVPANGPQFQKELARFRKLPEPDRARAIVRFVQDDVRYVGVEIGQHSHQPHAPAWVLERGFGDCKDKSLLLVSLLRAVGLEAWPALVHASNGQQLPAIAPSPNGFNHAIVQLALSTGPRFIDPTLTLRRGALETMRQPRYHHALLIKPGATALEPIPLEPVVEPTWELEQHWQVPTAGGTPTLTITTTARAQEASALRHKVQSTPRTELVRDLEKGREEDLEVTLTPRDFTWNDDEAKEVFVLVERYEASAFFVGDEHQFSLLSLSHDLKRITDPQRTWPFATWHPTYVREVIRYDAPAPLDRRDFELENKTISHPAFELKVAQQVLGQTLSLEWELRSLKDRVLPEEIESYRARTDEAWAHFGYEVHPHRNQGARGSQEPAGTGALLVFFGGLMVLVLLVAGAGRGLDAVRRYRETARARKFKARQVGAPGELASSPVQVTTLAAGRALFTSTTCPVGHAWGEVASGDTVRLGDERVTVLTRRCTSCDAKDSRYVKLPPTAV